MANQITGWEITLYSPPVWLQFESTVSDSSQDVNSRVTEEGIVRSGVDNDGVMSQHSESVNLSDTSMTAVAEQQKPQRAKKTATKFLGNSYFSFNYCEDSTRPLGIYEVESPPNLHEISSSFNDDERMLPVPRLLKGWQRETRERQNGLKDKFYTHPLCDKRFRSMLSVVDYIRSVNNILNPQNLDYSEQEFRIQATLHHHGASSSVSENKKRANSGPLYNSETKRTRIFPIVFAEDHNTARKRYKKQIEIFFATAYQNLMNLKPAT